MSSQQSPGEAAPGTVSDMKVSNEHAIQGVYCYDTNV